MASGKLILILASGFYVGLFISFVETRNTYNNESHSSMNTDNFSHFKLSNHVLLNTMTIVVIFRLSHDDQIIIYRLKVIFEYSRESCRFF